MSKRNGGPAFPQIDQLTTISGMTLRDYFAAKVMQALIANPDNTTYDFISKHAYEMADAMLAERERAQ